MQLTLKDIITNVTNIDPNDLPDDVFIHNNGKNAILQNVISDIDGFYVILLL